MRLSSIAFDRENNPSKYNIKRSYHILKKAGEKITVEQLKRILQLIRWDIHHHGCDNWTIYNNTGKRGELTFWFRSDDECELKLWNDYSILGKNGKGAFYVELSKCTISITDGHAISIKLGSGKDMPFFISFYNFDRHYTKVEKYISELPRDYCMVMKCSKCGAYMTKTSDCPGVYFVLNGIVSLAGAFSAPRCPKCNNKTYSDINFGYDTFIQRVSTKRPVTVAALRKRYYKELEEIKRLSELEPN